MKKVLTAREDRVVNALRADGYTVNEIAKMFKVSVDVVKNANPARKAAITRYSAAKRA